jgi:hypothetical protein
MNDEAHSETVTITLEGSTYRIVPTAFRAHFQLVGEDGKLLGLLELVEGTGSFKFMVRPASGTGMTQTLMLKIADAASAAGLFGEL